MAMFGSQRTTIDRGVTSFAPEPGFFGFVLFNYFVILVLLREYIPKRSFYVLQSLNVFSTIFLAQSAVAIVYFILMFGIIVYFWLLSLFSHKFNKYQLMLYPIFLVLIITAISIIVQEISDLRDFRAVTLATSLWDSADFLISFFLTHPLTIVWSMLYYHGLPCLILLVFLRVLGHLIILATSHWIFLMGFLVWRGRTKGNELDW